MILAQMELILRPIQEETIYRLIAIDKVAGHPTHKWT